MDYLYGKMYKDIVVQNYSGICSETANVSIDNAHRTIKVDVVTDSEMSSTSTHPVENRAIKKYIDDQVRKLVAEYLNQH